MNKALLIIDMQLMPFLWKNYSGKEIYNEQKLLDNTQKLIEKPEYVKFRFTIFFLLNKLVR